MICYLNYTMYVSECFLLNEKFYDETTIDFQGEIHEFLIDNFNSDLKIKIFLLSRAIY